MTTALPLLDGQIFRFPYRSVLRLSVDLHALDDSDERTLRDVRGKQFGLSSLLKDGARPLFVQEAPESAQKIFVMSVISNTVSVVTPNEVLTLLLAAYAALVATGSAVVGIVALVQNRSHFGQPNWESSIGAVWSDPESIITWRLQNFGPREAIEVSLFARSPGRMTPNSWRVWRGGEEHNVFTRSNWVGYAKSIGAQEFLVAEIDAATGRGQIIMPVGGEWGEYISTPGDPLLGKWRFRLEWRADPSPQKVRRQFQSLRIKRNFKLTNLGQ